MSRSDKGNVGKKREQPVKSLTRFDYGLVGKPLEGLFGNVDRGLGRRIEQAAQRGDLDADRCLSLLRIICRFAWNSYHSVLYLAGDLPEDLNRRPNFVLVVPSINRQLLDILFSLVYMLDDMRDRSLEYQRSGWRELREEYLHFRTYFADDPEWKPHFRAIRRTLKSMEERFGITEAQKKNAKLVPYWPTPGQLEDIQTPSKPFIRYLQTWLYADTSAQAHFSAGGLLKTALFLIADVVGEDAVRAVRGDVFQRFRSSQMIRTAFIVREFSASVRDGI